MESSLFNITLHFTFRDCLEYRIKAIEYAAGRFCIQIPVLKLLQNTTNIFAIVTFINWSMTSDCRRQKCFPNKE